MASNAPGPGIEALTYRLAQLEGEVSALRAQLLSYVPARENDLQLKSIQQAQERVERDLVDARAHLTDINTRIAEEALAAQRRDATARERQDALQILALRAIVGMFLTIAIGVLLAFASHVL